MLGKIRKLLKNHNCNELGGVIALTDKSVYEEIMKILDESETPFAASENDVAGIYMISVEGLSILTL